MRSKYASTNIRGKPTSTTSASWTPPIWWRRSDVDVATEPFLVAEIRDAGADGAGGCGAAPLCFDLVPDQQNPLEQSRLQRAAGVFGLYLSGGQKSKILAAGPPCDQSPPPRCAGP